MKKYLHIILLLFLIFFLIGCDTFIVSPLIRFMWIGTALGSAIVAIVIDKWNFSTASYLCGSLSLLACLIFKYKLKDNFTNEESQLLQNKTIVEVSE